MNPVNATALYVSASRAVLQCDPRQPHTFAEMYKLLPFFRQSLACLVCGKLLQDPIAPTNSMCQHYVCFGCKGQKMQMKPSCSWCKDYSCFQENRQLSLLVQCYRRLCLYVTHSPLLQPIVSQVGGSPEIMALLEEVLMSHQEEMEMEIKTETEEPSPIQEEVNPSGLESLTPTEAPPVPAELSADPQSSSSNPPCSSQKCNGAVVLEDLAPSSPELEVCELVEEQPQGGLSVSNAGCSGLELSLASGPLAPTPATVCSLRDGDSSSRELEEGDVLLLSVEEVLQTLDPLQSSRDSLHTQPDRTHTHIATDRAHTQMYIQLDTAHNYTQIQMDRTHTVTCHGSHTHTSSLDPPPAPKPLPVRISRKRSHSESDRERVKPLPIASILHGSTSHFHSPTLSHTLHTQQPAPSPTVPSHTYSSLSNGAPPKPNRPAPNHSKGARKHIDQGPKKPHVKARSGGSKSKDRSKDQRLLSGCLVPPMPAKPPYKKPVEKKGCKCGRATQNPSVLTCRGQRCPCYSNRKACLDCICRGCQNSYMANGEKKLEAFAVPEKALEQTRLTLGINLTSITAAAALRNPATTSIHGNTLLNVATAAGAPMATAFLSPSPPQEPTYEDSLELLIG
ncbi:E3 ubiquitin-protein ligase MSL2-like [Diretmus argenteus]